MKKVISGAIIILSLGVVGCTSKEVNVTLEDYSNKVDENNNVIECIEVKTDSEKISKETVNKIFEMVSRKGMDTELSIINTNGDKIGNVKENDSKTEVNVEKQFSTTKSSEVIFNDSEKLKESISTSNEAIANAIMPRITGMMELYDSMVDNVINTYIKEDRQEANLIILATLIRELAHTDIKEIEDKAKYVTDNEKFIKAFESFKSITESYNNMVDKANIFLSRKSSETLADFKSAVLEFRAGVARYTVQIDSLDGSGSSLTEQFN